MFYFSQDLKFSSIKARAPHLELVLDDGCASVHVVQSGDIDQCRLLPSDTLILHKMTDIDAEQVYESGELLLLKPRGFGRLMLGRKYGDQILMEPFGKPVSLERWGIVGAVLAIERPIGSSSPLRSSAHVALYNAPERYEQHIQEEYICDTVYVSELSRVLQSIAPESSCVLALCPEQLSVLLAQVPEGVMWISPQTRESVSSLAQAWQVHSKREQRRKWLRQHQEEPQHHRPLPNPQDVVCMQREKEDVLASK